MRQVYVVRCWFVPVTDRLCGVCGVCDVCDAWAASSLDGARVRGAVATESVEWPRARATRVRASASEAAVEAIYALEYKRTQLPPNGPNAPGLLKPEGRARALPRMLHARTYES